MLNGIIYGVIPLVVMARVITLAGITLLGVLPNWRLTMLSIRRSVIDVLVQFMLVRLLVTFIAEINSDVNEAGHDKGRLPLSPEPLNWSDCRLDIAVQLTASIGPARPMVEAPGAGVSIRVASNCRLLRQVGKATGAYEVVEF